MFAGFTFSLEPKNRDIVRFDDNRHILSELMRKHNLTIMNACPEINWITTAFIIHDGRLTNDRCVVLGVYPENYSTFKIPPECKNLYHPFPIVLEMASSKTQSGSRLGAKSGSKSGSKIK